MKNTNKLAVLGLVLTTGLTAFAPAVANADGLQQTKNTWRNIATGAAIVTGIGLANHNGTETTLGAIGTVIGLGNYEQARHEQSVDQNGPYCDQPANRGPNTNVVIRLGDGWVGHRDFRRDGRRF
jgi:hypothetical protein